MILNFVNVFYLFVITVSPLRMATPFSNLLQNPWTNFNQTWHKTSFWEGGSSLFKYCYKIFFFRTTGPILTKLGTKHLLVKGIRVFTSKKHSILKWQILFFHSFAHMCLLIGTVSQVRPMGILL